MRRTALILAILAIAGCRTGRNYETPEGPRYAGGPREGNTDGRAAPDTLRLVSFNIEFSLQVDSAIAVLGSDPALRDADVVLLQEMNEEATGRIAAALGLWYVYYPAIFHFRTDQNVGNTVLSRWPIVEDWNRPLPPFEWATSCCGSIRPISAPWETWRPLAAVTSCAQSWRMPSATPG